MKKKAYLLVFTCLVLAVELFGINVSAAELSGTAKQGSLSQQSGEIKPPDGEAIQKDGGEKSETVAVGQEGEGIQPAKNDEEIQPGEDSGGTQPGEGDEKTQPEKDGGEAAQPEKDKETKPGKGDKGSVKEEKPYKTKLSLGLLLYKGDTTFVGVHYFKKDVYHVVSSDPSVVKISKKGRITALKCGKAIITAILENDNRRDMLVLHVRVKASSYAKTSSHGGRDHQSEACATGWAGSVPRADTRQDIQPEGVSKIH